MTEETKHPLAAKELSNESKKLDKGAVEHKSLKKSPEHFHNVCLEPVAVNNLAKFAEKEKDNTQQREAVIRPQQAGKIDFKSLQNHSFNSNRTWSSGKDSPQSPSGKSRNRDKSKKSGKGERGNPQQLYRLSITNPRSNPTIGIAYPQQKVSPPKKIESSRGPVSGSYRFHVPSIPEREAELQQEELQFRCFQESSPNLTSQSYTSQAVATPSGGPAHQNPSQPQQKPNPIESNTTQPANENLFPDFQLSEIDTWQSPDRTFRSTSFGLTSQKPNNLVDFNKTNGSFMPMPFQYGYPLLEESGSDSFPCDRNTQSQDYIDISPAPNQVSHNSFSFPSSAEGHEAMQNNAQFGNDQVEDRQSYQLHPKPPQYVQTQHGVQSSVPSNDESSVSSTRQSEQSKSVSDKSDSFSPVDDRDTGFAVVGKRGCHLKNGTTSQRVLIQGSVHHIRNISQGSSSQIHVISPPHNGIHISPGPLDKSVSKHHVRVSHPWNGPNKAFPPPLIDQTSTPYPFQYQPAPEQRQNSINGRMPWQQIRFTTAMPSQNRIDLSRQLSNQQLTFLIGPSDWQDDSKPHKNSNQKDSNNFLNKKTNEGFSNQRQDSIKQGCNTIPPCHFTNKVDTNQGQVGDAKNKSLYFGINPSVPVTSSRNCSYPPLHVAPLGLKMVSPYDSPSHSPTQNPTSSSTCPSLSPASTNSVNSNSDDSQISKVLSPQFYQQQQDKALISSSSMNTNQHHYHSEASRGLHYKQEKSKENIASFMSHNRHSKSNMDNGKGCLETYRPENHPPPPYSAHQLATSLVSANLDQLDVLLTCKQCDQNFNNLVSFLDHKQYCGQHTFAQNDFKDVPKVEDIRKFQTDHTKAMSSGSSYTILRSSSDLHLSLLGLNKNGEIVPDNETKGDIKDDPMKLMLPSAPLPDLEMEDPKLDSLITEALNGLGYQSDNAEIDSSFIDAFVDDDLTTTKCTSTRQTLTAKDSTTFEGRTNSESTSSERSEAHSKYPFDSDLDSLSSDSKLTDSPFKESQHELIQKEGLNAETSPTESQSQESNCTQIEWKTRKSEQREEENDYSSKFLLSSKFSARCGPKSLQSSTALVKTTSTCASKSPTAQKPIPTEGKRKRTGGGSWSKELIHKIVQQKNKLHKLHVKGTKNMQFSLVMERVTPAVQNPTFREYDYVSDSDDDCEPVKIASQGRLSQSIRCKYTYTKECKGRIRADKSRESSWKQNISECVDPKKALDVSPSLMKDNPGHQSLRRRSSRSSTSSELSTSISICSDSIGSPKSTDHTDSDSEKRIEAQRKDQNSLEQNAYEESPPRIRKESSTSLALTFTKNTKRYSTDKILLTEHNDRFTSSKCSSIICKTEETASEHKMTKSTVSLARFKTTRLEIEEKGDHLGFEGGILATTEEPFKKDYPKNITSPRGSGITPNPMETTNNSDSSHVFKLKKDAVTSKSKSHRKRTNSSEMSAPIFEKASNDSISSEEASRSSNDLFPDPPPLCSSLADKVCLSPSKVHDATAQKNAQCLIPYPSEHDQSLIKSPLSFDTTSMFGDLSVGGFESNLYPDIQLAKESFSPLETITDKKELFESSFSPFLEQRDWNLMVDVTPVLPDEISQYKEDSDSNENKTNFNHVPFALPEKLMDYNPNLNSNVSVDDLEIKRIVTELESQLQTAKLSSPPPLDSELPKQLTMSKFSPLRLDPDSEDEDSSLQMNCSSENLQIVRPVDSQSALFSEPDLPWSSPLPFGLMCGQQGLHTPTHSSTINTPTDSENDHLDIKDSMGLTVLNAENGSPMHPEDKTEKNDSLDKSEEMLEHEIYTENLMKSLEVISDSLSSGFTSPQSSPNQESVVPEEHEKQENEHSEQNMSEHVESRNTKAELTKFSVETFNTNTTTLEETTSEISGSDNGTKVYINETSNNTLHDELVANEQQLAESSFESPPTTCVNSNEIDSQTSSVSIYEHKCESPVNQTEIAECNTQFHIKDSNYTMQNSDFSKIFHFSASPTIPKDENALCVEKIQKCDEDSALTAKPEIISEDNGHATDETTDCTSDTEIQQPISNITSPHCEDQLSAHSQLIHTQQLVSPKHLPVVQDEHEYIDSMERAMPDMTLFSVQSECEDNQQKNTEQSPQLIILTQAPEFSYKSIQSPSELRDNCPLPSTITPSLSKSRPALEDNNSDHINIGKSDTFVPATTELDNSFNPHLDLVEITGSKISSPGTLLAVDKISKQPLSEHSGTLDNSQDDLKLSPLNYSEACFNEYSFNSKFSNKGNDKPYVKSNSTDSYILNACAFSHDKPLSSSPTYNANEQAPNIQGHLTGLDIPKTSINNKQNYIKYSSGSASCSNYVEEGSTIISEQILKLGQTDMDVSHLPPESVDDMDLHLKFHKKADYEKMDHQMIINENDAMQRSTMSDVKEIPKPLIQYAKAASMGLPFTSVQNEGQSLKSNETKTSQKKGGTHNAVQGKFQCEICAMFFRTQPGLKRHKAMKHVVKDEGVSPIENLNMSSQMFMPILMPHPTEKALKGSMDVLSPAVLSHPNRSEISDVQEQQADPHLIFQGIASDSHVSKIPGSCDIDQRTSLNEKANNSNTTTHMSSEMFAPELVKQDTFSDEILSTLQTDILQAISPDFPSMVQQNCPTSPEKQVPNSRHSYHEVSVREEQKSMVVTNSSEEQLEETTYSIGHSILHKEGDTYDIDKVVTKYFAIKPNYVQTEDIHYPLGDSSVDIKREKTCSPAEDSHALTETLGIAPDLKAFFDDESTFSQLFPRNDDRKRKKCARVYGKSNKKQKQLSCLILDYPPTGAFIDKYEESKENKMGHKFISDMNDPCEYETILTPKSLVKSSMENACHSKDYLIDNQPGYEENVETGIKEFFCEKEGTIRQPLEHQDVLHDCIVSENTIPQEDCKPEVPATACPLQMVCVQDNAPCSLSTEIPNLNTTIQIPAPFFEPERDMPLVETIASTEVNDPERPCKKPVERKCRKRIEPGLKPKDKQYKCKVCFTWFLTLGELDFHKLSHNPSPPPTCYMCVQRKFSSREQLRDHLREKHAKNKAGVWTCGMCLKEISDVWMYNEHLREHATQFARRGQSQSSLLDMPGCFMQENAVKNFISSIMQHRPSRATKGDNLKSLSKEERRTSLDVNGQELKGPEEFDSISLKTKMSIGGGSKHCALTTLEVLPKAETPSKNAEMHPNCKDPSRDCHHCGKQFPKPFKLQRHLVVHSLQKIFLCHKCPVSYQEAKELKDHLKHEHEETDEPDSKHTTLYTCELCADVMHVIKKSFICSTCNYTFSKKEQFDRHMEKHLAGGNKIFKFRRVMRPCRPFNSKDDISDMPPSKKRKATESSLDITVSHMQGIKSVLPIIDDTAQNSTEEHSTETNNTSVKIEDVAEDFPVVAKDIIECTVQTDTAEQSLSTELKKEDESSSPSHELQTDEPREVSATDKEALTEICDVKIEDDCCTIPTTLLDSEVNVASISRQNEDGVETNPSESLENASEQGETTDSSVCTIQVCSQTDVSLPKQDMQGLSSCNDFELSSVKQSSNETSYLKQDQTIETLFSINRNENIQDVHTHDSEQPATAHAKHITMVKSEETLKQSLENNPRCLSTTDSARHTNSSCEDKDSAKQQKKRKELKTSHSSQRTPSPTARENLGIDPRFKKKFRPSRCENIDGQRKTDLPNDYPVLTSVKDDTVSNKIISKHKIGSSNLGLHLKKGPVEFSPKKVEIVRHFNGDCKGKKSIPRRPVHSTSSRVSTLNNSFNKSRSKPGVRSIETHSYRTAESQNNLLSQLFGQRLTSFKIPLRKDTSESIKD
ncbi:zinc finger protein 469-like [Cyprinus carpio]|uniref:Zinc finger protein 469-like n=1 Tax=Cyprinus carpio TaxID=7962 RepID=A0A9Q9XW02_CYPCA|nr:zinc finger protein 469-like [Cyprinus carpio]XP_042609034.1 zinc finger protein 469-like [Cyprinus carpio]XP_042609037.1 zinc finger protein 469-like [Cyprinus carpio]